jgi:hypothetical protein
MPTISYAKVPLLAEFQRDSSAALARRSQDRILCHLDSAIAHYHVAAKRWGKRNVVLCDLFVTANYWLKSFREKDPATKPERYQAVLALFERWH